MTLLEICIPIGIGVLIGCLWGYLIGIALTDLM